jgi:serine/threonine protein phosphatase PrpC
MLTFPSQSSSVVVSVGVQCHVGKQRTENQDRVTRSETPFGDLFVVADGIGGYQGGAEAAQVTVDGFVNFLKANGNLTLPDALQQAVRSVNAALRTRSAARNDQHGMGSTVVLCAVNGNQVTYAHAGDSRAYLLRGGHLQQLTRDHSVMERMIAQGLLTPAQAREHPDASVLTRALGQSTDISLDIAGVTIQPKDALLLCSDGLWGYARHEEIEAVAAAESLSASAVASAMLNLALEGGGGDNISIQFLRFLPLEPAKKTAATMLGMPAKWGLAALALASVLVIAIIAMATWNNQHPVNPTIAPVTSAAKQTPPVASNTQRPEAPPPAQTSKPTPQQPSPNTATKTVSQKTKVAMIRVENGSTGEWAHDFGKLAYLEPIEQRTNAVCLSLGGSVRMLYYSSQSAPVATKVQQDLKLSASQMKELSADVLSHCSSYQMVAMPAVPSISDAGKTAQESAEEKAREVKGAIQNTIPPLPTPTSPQ